MYYQTLSKFILLFILLFISLIKISISQQEGGGGGGEVVSSSSSIEYDSYIESSSDNDGDNHNNKYYNFEKSLGYKNKTFISNSINSKPTIIYFTYIIKPYYKFGYIGLNEIKNGSSTHVANGHIPIDDLNTPFEMLITKSHNTMIVTGIGNTKTDKYNGCKHYFDYGDIRVENCKMWVNLVDISFGKRLSHYSIIYNDTGSTNTLEETLIIGMNYIERSVIIEGDEIKQYYFSIVTTNDFFYIDGSFYNNSNQTLLFYETEIKIDINEIDNFKKSHDKLNNIYYAYIREIGIHDYHHIIIFNINTFTLKTIKVNHKIPTVNEKLVNELDFSTIGISGWNNKFIISGCPKSYKSFNQTNIYSIEIDPITLNSTVAKLLTIKPYKVTQYVKTENSQYFMFYNKQKSLLTSIDLSSDTFQQEDFKIGFKMKVPEYAQIVELYAFHQDSSHITPTKTEGLTSGKLFVIVFYPIFAFALISLIISCLVLSYRKRKLRRLLRLNNDETIRLADINDSTSPTPLPPQLPTSMKQLEKEEKLKLFIETQQSVDLDQPRIEKYEDEFNSDSSDDS